MSNFDDFVDDVDFDKTKHMTPTFVYDKGWDAGFVFAKYTKRIDIDDDLLRLLDNSKQAIKQYHAGYCEGFKDGLGHRHQMPNLIY